MSDKIRLSNVKNLSTFLKAVIDEAIATNSNRSSHYDATQEERARQEQTASAIASSPGKILDEEDDAPEPSRTHNDETENVLASGEVSVGDVVDKLNTIRSGHSLKDSKIQANMAQYVESLSKAEKTGLLAFLKAIAQIVIGEVPQDDVKQPDEKPAEVKMKKDVSGGKKVTIKPNVVKAISKEKSKESPKEDSSGPAPIRPVKRG